MQNRFDDKSSLDNRFLTRHRTCLLEESFVGIESVELKQFLSRDCEGEHYRDVASRRQRAVDQAGHSQFHHQIYGASRFAKLILVVRTESIHWCFL